MEIIRENGIDKVMLSFRMKVSLKKFDTIKTFWDENFKYKANPKKTFVIIIIDMEYVTSPDCIKTLLKEYKLDPKDVNIFIGITSSYDMGGLTVPQSVLNIIREIDCDLHFSFVSA